MYDATIAVILRPKVLSMHNIGIYNILIIIIYILMKNHFHNTKALQTSRALPYMLFPEGKIH